jgi:hypothetical protein
MKRQQSCGNKGQLPKQFSEKGNEATREPGNEGKMPLFTKYQDLAA